MNTPTTATTELFALTDEEAFVVAAVKHWVMHEDRDLDPDREDRVAKRGPVTDYGLAFHQACQLEELGSALAAPNAAAVAGRVASPGWAPDLRVTFGALDFTEFTTTLKRWEVVEALLGTVTQRSRAVLLLVELLAFYPWPDGVKYEKQVRVRKMHALAEAMPATTTPAFADELDRELRRRARKFALRNMNWSRVALIAGGGAVLGAITGGLAAPLLGGAFGSTMGLGGAAATNAGLAALGGGSVAAGGMGVAGGTMLVGGVGSVGASTVALGGTAWRAQHSSFVLADMVKVDVLSEYIEREVNDGEIARLVIVDLERTVRANEAEIAALEQRLDELDGLATVAERNAAKAKSLESELETLQRNLDESSTAVRLREQELSRLKRRGADE